MSAWSKNFEDAPKGQSILVRNPKWDCLAVMYFLEEESWSGWAFAENLLHEVSDPLDNDEIALCEWAEIPT